ncbi:MAG TPA: hypothetical protein VGL56_20925 [Fimbriimonadaceae bacterium]|jgi:hypothetical protein
MLIQIARRADMNIPDTATEFEIAQHCAELIDALRPEKRKQVMALLNTRYEIEPPRKRIFPATGKRYSMKRKPRQ